MSDYNLDGCYRLLVAVVNRSLEDSLISHRLYHKRRPNKNRAMELARDVMKFTESEWFEDICEYLGHRPDVVSTHMLLRMKDGKRPCHELVKRTLSSL